MNCPKCGSANVNVQVVNETDTKLVTKHHGILWWVLVGWWWLPIKWICLTVPAIIVKLFRPKRYKMVTRHTKVSMAVCQNCGHTWEAGRTR